MADSKAGSEHSSDFDSPGKSRPPSPPTSPRRLRIRPIHGGFLLVLLFIVGLAAVGVFGKMRGTAKAQNAAVRVSVEYPERLRYKEIAPLRVRVQNRGAQSIDTLALHFDSTYIEAFSNVRFLPSATEPWVVGLTDVEPGETQRVQVHLQAEGYGSHRGRIQAKTPEDTVGPAVRTFVFP